MQNRHGSGIQNQQSSDQQAAKRATHGTLIPDQLLVDFLTKFSFSAVLDQYILLAGDHSHITRLVPCGSQYYRIVLI
ncbi:hypothetical protein ARMGADRAFT_1013323 [Armillaria gallica]|uniref:Uncharacterized protein n=1 Tax=Armillaria gallica TaxID=47427 RepID=A0A2H3DA19_ARMGA|nr:hypothetical protein ARMGADRAFT_1013323 [Armillaria gallica]